MDSGLQVAAESAVREGLVALDNGSSACDSTSVTGCDVALSAVLLGLPSAVVVALVYVDHASTAHPTLFRPPADEPSWVNPTAAFHE